MAVEAATVKKERSSESICRLCFTEREQYRLIFEDKFSSLHEWIGELTSLQIVKVPGAPAALCVECEKTLKSFESFREMCFTNDRVFKEMFPQDDTRNDNSDDIVMNNEPGLIEDIIVKCENQEPEILDSTIELQDNKTIAHSAMSEEKNCDTEPDVSIVNFVQSEDQEIVKVGSTTEFPEEVQIVEASIPNLKDSYYGTEEVQTSESQPQPERVSEDMKGKKQCTICNTFVKGLKRHMQQLHTGRKSHICKWCNKPFKRSHELTIHIRSHTQEKPFKCDACSRSFSIFSNLVRHERSPSGCKPFSCNVCQARFIEISLLEEHLKMH